MTRQRRRITDPPASRRPFASSSSSPATRTTTRSSGVHRVRTQPLRRRRTQRLRACSSPTPRPLPRTDKSAARRAIRHFVSVPKQDERSARCRGRVSARLPGCVRRGRRRSRRPVLGAHRADALSGVQCHSLHVTGRPTSAARSSTASCVMRRRGPAVARRRLIANERDEQRRPRRAGRESRQRCEETSQCKPGGSHDRPDQRAHRIKPRHRHRLSSAVDDLDELAGGTGSALHADVRADASEALVMSMQRDVRAKPLPGHARGASGRPVSAKRDEAGPAHPCKRRGSVRTGG